MRRSKDELNKIHKEKCKNLKQIRARIADELGIDLHQRECTYEGYCSGTCLKCKSEEMLLNAAILKQNIMNNSAKGKLVVAGVTTAVALGLTGCQNDISGGISANPEEPKFGISEQESEETSSEEKDASIIQGILDNFSGKDTELSGDVEMAPDNPETISDNVETTFDNIEATSDGE